ncbi:hypothetical protein [uncultured Castellaniella sp.]|uniref:hypothetical protein n=1 Tax=uncultured Castellaniella sp. TaxID=647907 RepID=UPI002636016D|nr:hypothetical protein [uncultured Castellaniella sp.]
MDKFTYSGPAEIRHLNCRKEGPEEEKVLTVDVKFLCTTNAAMFDFFDDALRFALYTDAGAVKNPALQPIGFSTTVMNCDLTILGRRYGSVEVSKFSLKPKDGHLVEMTFGISIQPMADEVAQLAEFVADEVDILIEPQPELDFGGRAAA